MTDTHQGRKKTAQMAVRYSSDLSLTVVIEKVKAFMPMTPPPPLALSICATRRTKKDSWSWMSFRKRNPTNGLEWHHKLPLKASSSSGAILGFHCGMQWSAAAGAYTNVSLSRMTRSCLLKRWPGDGDRFTSTWSTVNFLKGVRFPTFLKRDLWPAFS